MELVWREEFWEEVEDRGASVVHDAHGGGSSGRVIQHGFDRASKVPRVTPITLDARESRFEIINTQKRER
jgi:hypothetical protein